MRRQLMKGSSPLSYQDVNSIIRQLNHLGNEFEGLIPCMAFTFQDTDEDSDE